MARQGEGHDGCGYYHDGDSHKPDGGSHTDDHEHVFTGIYALSRLNFYIVLDVPLSIGVEPVFPFCIEKKHGLSLHLP